MRCERWWVPGLVVSGDAAHAVGPEAGLGAGLGLGDALALAIAVEQSPDADAACAAYELWRRPAVRPYEEIGATRARRRQASRGALAAEPGPALRPLHAEGNHAVHGVAVHAGHPPVHPVGAVLVPGSGPLQAHEDRPRVARADPR